LKKRFWIPKNFEQPKTAFSAKRVWQQSACFLGRKKVGLPRTSLGSKMNPTSLRRARSNKIWHILAETGGFGRQKFLKIQKTFSKKFFGGVQGKALLDSSPKIAENAVFGS
jgi:hypothetical protein